MLTRMLGSYGDLGYALEGILKSFNFHTGYMVYDELENRVRGNSVCSFKMYPIMKYFQRTSTQKATFEPFDEMRTSRPKLLQMMERAKQNSRSKWRRKCISVRNNQQLVVNNLYKSMCKQ